MPESVASAFNRPSQWKNNEAPIEDIIEDNTGYHDDKIPCVEPEELSPRILRPPVLSNLFYKAATKERFVNNLDHVGSNHEPERKYQGHSHNDIRSRLHPSRQAGHSYSASAQTRTSPLSSISTWIKFGRQQTGQSSTYSWLSPADRSTGITISSPQASQT